jgi:predicted lipoprotein with Yx(FWY)xxD motif
MYRVLTPAAVLAAAIALAACGSSNNDSSGSTASASMSGKTIQVRSISGVGDVLVDSSGHALYTPAQEADGKIRCTGGCATIWLPLDVGSGKPTVAGGVSGVGVTQRPDGARQATLDNKPLYTFAEDTPGKVTGNGFKDEFAGQKFTWHVVMADGATSNTSSSGSGGGYTY